MLYDLTNTNRNDNYDDTYTTPSIISKKNYYKANVDDFIRDDELEYNNFKIWFYIIIIIACIFFIVSVILTIFFCKKFHFNKRKIKANELDDDYDYSSNKDKEQNQNGLLINE